MKERNQNRNSVHLNNTHEQHNERNQNRNSMHLNNTLKIKFSYGYLGILNTEVQAGIYTLNFFSFGDCRAGIKEHLKHGETKRQYIFKN